MLERWPVPAPGPEREEADWTGLLRGSILSCFACWLLAKRKKFFEGTHLAGRARVLFSGSRLHLSPGECVCLGVPLGITGGLSGGQAPERLLTPEPVPSSQRIRRLFSASRSPRALLSLRHQRGRIPTRFSGGSSHSAGLHFQWVPIELLLKTPPSSHSHRGLQLLPAIRGSCDLAFECHAAPMGDRKLATPPALLPSRSGSVGRAPNSQPCVFCSLASPSGTRPRASAEPSPTPPLPTEGSGVSTGSILGPLSWGPGEGPPREQQALALWPSPCWCGGAEAPLIFICFNMFLLVSEREEHQW